MAYLRTQFTHIRAIVPLAAKSAATMMALSADEIVMGPYSELGPIDPQFRIQIPEGIRSAPAQAIEEQFKPGRRGVWKGPDAVAAWLPILRGYGPGLLAVCQHQRQLAETIVGSTLANHMFAGEDDARQRASRATTTSFRRSTSRRRSLS